MPATHEDIRYKVIQEAREAMLRAITHIRTANPQVYSNLQTLLEEYQEIIEKKEDIPLIIKNERIIKDVGKPDIEVFGGKILVEVKVKPSEFASGFEQLSKYVKFYPNAAFAVITDFSSWEFYKVEKGTLDKVDMDLNQIIEDVFIKGVRLALSTENVRNMFTPIVLLEDELGYLFKTYAEKDGALFEAYQNIMKRLYEKASADEVENLFLRHTLMQMIVSSCLTASSGKKTTSL